MSRGDFMFGSSFRSEHCSSMFLRLFRLAYLSTYMMLSAVALVLTPSRLVVEHGAPASAVCSTNSTYKKMAWEASQGSVSTVEKVAQLNWTVPKVTEWDIKPLCYINVDGKRDLVKKTLLVTVYKIPEVSISLVNNTAPITEEKSFWLQCNIRNVAPVNNVIVNWYKEETLVKRDNETSEEATKEPQNKTGILQITPKRNDNGAQYRCEAQLELGVEGPQPPPRSSSLPLNINVHYKPQFSNHTAVLVNRGAPITLNCSVNANPPATYHWTSAHLEADSETSFILHPSRSGIYTCTASNLHGHDTKVFTVKEQERHVVFWSTLGTGLVLAGVLIVVFACRFKEKCSSNSII